MKVILPVAGLGKRMRPHTWSKPKPLLNIAGKAVLGHLLDRLLPLDLEEVVFITGWLGDQIQDYVDHNYDLQARYVVQEELKGQAHAVYLAREYLTGPCLIIYVDTLWEADLTRIQEIDADGIIFTKVIEDPRRFGVAVEQDGRVVRYIEKPETCEHHKATIGMFYVRDGAKLLEAVEYVLREDIRFKGEYYLANAFNVMIDRGAKFVTSPVSVWEDCGKPETVLHTHRYLLENGHAQMREGTNSVVIPPVYIAESAKIENAVVGPYVTLGDDVTVRNAIIRDSIVEAGSLVEDITLDRSLIGRQATIRGTFAQLNMGDDSLLDLEATSY